VYCGVVILAFGLLLLSLAHRARGRQS